MIPLNFPHYPPIGPRLLRGKYRGASSPSVGDGEAPSLARTLNGTDQWFSIADNADVSLNGSDWTIFFFANPTDLANFYALIQQQNRAVVDCFLNQTTGVISLGVLNAAGTVVSSVNAASGWTAGQFNTAELFGDLGDAQIGISVNDGAEATAAITDGAFDSIGTMEFCRLGTSNLHFKGSWGRTGLWKRRLTAAETAWIVANKPRYADLGQGGTDGADLLTDLAAYWDFEDAAGANAVDAHDNNDLTQNGDPGSGSGP